MSLHRGNSNGPSAGFWLTDDFRFMLVRWGWNGPSFWGLAARSPDDWRLLEKHGLYQLRCETRKEAQQRIADMLSLEPAHPPAAPMRPGELPPLRSERWELAPHEKRVRRRSSV